MATTTNTIPAVNNLIASIDEGETISLNVLSPYSDPQGDLLSWTLTGISAFDPVSLTPLGTSSLNGFSVSADGQFTYRALLDLAQGQQRTEIFYFTVFDGMAYTNTSIAVTVTGSGTGIVAPDDYIRISTGQSIVIPVLDNDSVLWSGNPTVDASTTLINDQSGFPFPITVTDPQTGMAAGEATRLFSNEIFFTPREGFTGKASFTYTALVFYLGATGKVETISYSASVVVDVLPPAPVVPSGTADAYQTTLITTLVVNAGQGVLANDIANGSLIRAQLVSGPDEGTLDFNSDGSFTFNPSAAMLAMPLGSETVVNFTYKVFNGAATASTPTPVTLTFARPAQPPVAVDDQLFLQEDQSLVIQAADLFGADGTGPQNDRQVEGQEFIEIRIVRLPQAGTLTLDGMAIDLNASITAAQLAAGKLAFVPPQDFSGSTSFEYIVRSNNNFSNPATVTLNVAEVPDSPTDLSPPQLQISFNEELDATNQVLSASPAVYKIFDPDSSPSSVATTLFFPELTNVDLIPESLRSVLPDALTLTQSFSPSGAGGLLTIAPALNTGPHNLDYLAVGQFLSIYYLFDITYSDGTHYKPDSVSFVVIGTNDSPVASADMIGPVSTGSSANFSGATLLANDTDPDHGETALLKLASFGFGDSVVAVPLTGSTTLTGNYGILTINADGQLSYAATTAASAALAKGAQASDTFAYTIEDPHGAGSTAALTFSVTGANRVPVSAADSYTTTAGQALTVAALSGVLNNDSDGDGDALSAILQGGPANGSLTLNPDGSFTYTPTAGFTGVDSFSYLASDGSAQSGPTLVSITVQAPPLVLDKKMFINEIAVNAGAATITINTNNGALPDKVTTGVGRIELFNFSGGSISAADLAKASLEVVGLNAKLSVIGMSQLTGLTTSANGTPLSGVALQANGSLVLYEPNASGLGIWQTYSAAGMLLLSGTYQDSSWGLGSSVSSPIAVNLVEAGSSIDFFAANGAPLTGLTDSGSSQKSLSGISSLGSGAHAAGSVDAFQLPDLSSPWFGKAQLSPGGIIPNDVLNLLNQNAQFSASLASSTDTVFGRVYDRYLSPTGGIDKAFVDYNDAGDWTYGGSGILTLGRENVILSKTTPLFVANTQDAADDANPLQGYQPVSDLIAGITNESGQTIAIFSGYGEGGRGHDFLYGVATDDYLVGGNGNDYLYGSSGNDWLEGGSGADRLMGAAGNDRLLGGSGRDWLNGGSGNDIFIFRSLSDSTLAAPDIIEDFVKAVDKIDLSAIDANIRRAGDQAFAFAGKSVTAIPNSVTWFESGGNTVIQVDVDGNKIADMQIVLLGTNLGLTATDFVL